MASVAVEFETFHSLIHAYPVDAYSR
jgi:hypothetical protein